MRVRFVVGIVLALLVAPAVAQAKGPAAATLEGKGVATPISVTGSAGDGRDLGTLSELTGFFAAAFQATPDPMLSVAPTENLGPQVLLSWRVPSGEPPDDTIRQELYPYAEGGPLTYTAPGQRLLTTQRTRGGWYRAAPTLAATLIRLGVPDQAALEAANAPPVTTASTRTASGNIALGRLVWITIALVSATLAGLVVMTTRRAASLRSARMVATHLRPIQ